jgi:hypothetical protein
MAAAACAFPSAVLILPLVRVVRLLLYRVYWPAADDTCAELLAVSAADACIRATE